MEYDLITVAETGPFQRKAARLLSEDEKNALAKVVKELVKYWSQK